MPELPGVVPFQSVQIPSVLIKLPTLPRNTEYFPKRLCLGEFFTPPHTSVWRFGLDGTLTRFPPGYGTAQLLSHPSFASEPQVV